MAISDTSLASRGETAMLTEIDFLAVRDFIRILWEMDNEQKAREAE